MSGKDTKKFPFDFQSLHPEEVEELQNNFGGTSIIINTWRYRLALIPCHEDGHNYLYVLVFFEYARVGPKGYILSADYQDDAENIYNMLLKSDDVIVNTFPRSGTTWTQEMVWLINKDLDYEAARSTRLSQRYTFLEFPSIFTLKFIDKIIEINTSNGMRTDVEYLKQFTELSSGVLAKCPSPRFIKTHLPLSFLPPDTIDTAKVVYVAREPRDVVVSLYFLQQLIQNINYKGDFKTYWNLFKNNFIIWSPFFEHLKEAWALRDHPNMLFLFYEELSRDLNSILRRVADFFGKQLSEEQLSSLCDHLSFEKLKRNDSVNASVLESYGLMEPNTIYVRKGKTGEWRDYFDEQMSQEAERWIQHNLRGTDLRFPHLD